MEFSRTQRILRGWSPAWQPLSYLCCFFPQVDEMFGFLPEEKTPAVVSAPTAFKVSM